MDVIEVSSQRRRQLVDVTTFVQEAVAASGVTDGICHVAVPHTTAAVMLNENADPSVGEDILNALTAILPKVTWRHGEGNSDAHFLSTLVGTVTDPDQHWRALARALASRLLVRTGWP
jgi:secondary thiamine-phosphate synthase enzyme